MVGAMDVFFTVYCLHVCLCVCTWGRCESIGACTQVSICALFVCHSPLKLQLPSRHDFPLCRNQHRSQHLTNMSHQLSLYLKKTSITLLMTGGYCFFWKNISHRDVTHTHTLKRQVSQMEGVTKLPHLPLWLPLMKPNTFGHPLVSIFVCLPTFCFFPIFFDSASPACTRVSERERETLLVISGLDNGARPRKVANNLA